MPASSGEYPMPRRARWCAGRRVMSCPLKATRPLWTGRRPMMLSMVVVFPAPFRPTRQTASVSPMASDRPRKTWAGPRNVSIRSTSSTAPARGIAWSSLSGGGGRAEQVGRDLLVPSDLVGGPVGQDGPLVHGDDTRAIAEHHVHVVLDDDRGDPLRPDDRADDVHDGGLLAGAHAARRLVEEEEPGAEGVGEGDVEELALALGEPPGRHLGLGGEPE